MFTMRLAAVAFLAAQAISQYSANGLAGKRAASPPLTQATPSHRWRLLGARRKTSVNAGWRHRRRHP